MSLEVEASYTSPPQRWQVRPSQSAEASALAAEAHIPAVLADLLIAVGITTADAAHKFLNPHIDQLHDPFLMLGMSLAVDRLELAIRRCETILLYGDYDVDGTTAVVLLKTAIELISGPQTSESPEGCTVRFHVPHRLREGYGIQSSVLESAAADGVSLVISVDTGMRAFAEARRARELNLDLIITDHHLPMPQMKSRSRWPYSTPTNPDALTRKSLYAAPLLPSN